MPYIVYIYIIYINDTTIKMHKENTWVTKNIFQCIENCVATNKQL